MRANADLVRTIRVLASTIEARDPHTGGPLWRVSQGAVGILLTVLLHGAVSAAEPVRTGFVLEPTSIPASEILAGGPPRELNSSARPLARSS